MRLRWLVSVFVALLTVAFGYSGGGVAHAETSSPKLSDVVSSTSSYGSYAASKLASLRSGATATSSVSCTTASLKRTNSAATLNVPLLGEVGAVDTSAETSSTSTVKTARSSSSTAGVNLLGGLIKASAVSSSSKATVNSTGGATAVGSATLTDLRIGGVAVSAKPAPNTSVSLKVGSTVIGKVVLNEQSRATRSWSSTATTRALSIYITSDNTLGLPIGTRIIVGSARSALKAAPAGKAGGAGFAVRARLADGTVKTGPYASAGVHCLGGTGRASIASAELPGLVDVGASKTETESSIGTSSRASVTSELADLSLLGGLISADAVTASTTTTRSAAGQPVQVANASKLANLRIAGIPLIDGTVEPNRVVRIPGVATVTLNKVTKTSTGITVAMLEIKLEKLLGSLPTGSIIEVGYSRTSLS